MAALVLAIVRQSRIKGVRAKGDIAPGTPEIGDPPSVIKSLSMSFSKPKKTPSVSNLIKQSTV